MKKIILLAFISVFVLTSCDKDSELRIVDNSASAPTLVNFAVASASLAVPIGTNGKELEVKAFVSTLSDSDRTFGLEVDPSSTADALNYEIPATISIPAGSYEGTFTAIGNDVNLTTESSTIIVNLVDESDTDNISTGGSVTLNIFEVCPIPDTYMVGSYEISDNATVFSGVNFDTRTVDIVASGDTSRSFTTTWSGGSNMNVVIDLVCNELIYASTNPTGYVAGTPQGPIVIAPATNNTSTYDVNSDLFFVVDYDNQAGGFGTFGGSFFLLKL